MSISWSWRAAPHGSTAYNPLLPLLTDVPILGQLWGSMSPATHPQPTVPCPPQQLVAVSHRGLGFLCPLSQGNSSPAQWRRPKLAQFFKRGPISFTNEGPMVPRRICSGPAHWPGGIVLPPPPREPIVPGPSGAAPGGLMGAGVPPAGAPAAQLAAAQGLGPTDL